MENFQSATSKIPKCQNGTLECSFEEMTVLRLIKANPTVRQQELIDTTGKSLRRIKQIMKSLQYKKYPWGKWQTLRQVENLDFSLSIKQK